MPESQPRQQHTATPGRRTGLLVLSVLVLLAVIAGWWFQFGQPQETTSLPSVREPDTRARFVGGLVCAECHADVAQAWRGSHHDLAMQMATPENILGDFNNATFTYNSMESSFYREDDKFMVRTEGPDGAQTEYEIKYTFGVEPLQQYLVPFPGGRLQALPIAWDTRPLQQGGQRWFHLYPDETINHEDILHWSGPYQNWNRQCASCHSTNLQKRYDAATDSYATRFSDINVSCEACHGAGSRHVEIARRTGEDYPAGSESGLLVALQSRWDEAWRLQSAENIAAQRDRPAAAENMNVCAACHARRSTHSETITPGAPLADSHRLALLTPPAYYVDGQPLDEVYVWGSFLQSRMYQQGVTCMDCHNPHTTQLRASGNELCMRCHTAARFDSEEHHFHKLGSAGAECVSCHMPTTNYMVIDARRDHSLRIPRPDLSLVFDSPNACTQCHTERDNVWAVAAMDSWYGKSWRERQHYGAALHAANTQGVAAVPALLVLAEQRSSPALVRATAVSLLQPYMGTHLLNSAHQWLQDDTPEVRTAAVSMFESADMANKLRNVAPLLEDPVRGVRIEAARVLADIPAEHLSDQWRDARSAALKEYIAGLQQNADWPAENVSLGNLYFRQGDAEQAITAYRRALALDAAFSTASANLADVYRALGQDATGERVLRDGLEHSPQDASLQHALGLLLVRRGELTMALEPLAQAAGNAPGIPRYSYVYAVALHSAGRIDDALAVLQAADTHNPNNPDILSTLVSIHRETGDNAAALLYARKLATAMPGDASLQQLVKELDTENAAVE